MIAIDINPVAIDASEKIIAGFFFTKMILLDLRS
jgi:hypothetical protein